MHIFALWGYQLIFFNSKSSGQTKRAFLRAWQLTHGCVHDAVFGRAYILQEILDGHQQNFVLPSVAFPLQQRRHLLVAINKLLAQLLLSSVVVVVVATVSTHLICMAKEAIQATQPTSICNNCSVGC